MTIVTSGADSREPLSEQDWSIIDEILDGDWDYPRDIQLSVEQAITAAPQSSEHSNLRECLAALWDLFEGMRLIRENADFKNATPHLTFAHDKFETTGSTVLRDIASFMALYSQALMELQNRNSGRALEILQQAQEAIRHESRYASRLQIMLDIMQPDIFALGGFGALAVVDYPTAKGLFDSASRAAQHVAQQHFEESTAGYNTFAGLAKFYSGIYDWVESSRKLNSFDFDHVQDATQLTRNALDAKDFLQRADTQSALLANIAHLNDGIIELIAVTAELSVYLRTLFTSSFKPDNAQTTEMRDRVATATKAFSQLLGEQSAPMIRSCDALLEKITNIERLAKPDKKDFSRYSGLVASALFLPLFLFVSWANSAFSVGLDPKQLIASCMVLGLIGGFGFGALRFKSFILPST